MLLLSKISTIVPYSYEWFVHRIGMMTGSMISPICAPEGIGTGAMTYIRNKVYEKLTNKTTEQNIVTEDTLWGIKYEPIAREEWKEREGCYDVIPDKHIVFDDLYSVTPDGLVVRDEKLVYLKGGTELNCEMAEIKCFPTPAKHMAHVKCKTPAELKKLDPKLHWQVISQVYWGNVFRGNAIFFHPDFPKNSPYRLGSVLYERNKMMDDFNFFKARTEKAKEIFNEEYEYGKPINETIKELTQ